MTFNNTQKLLAGALALVLVAGMTSPAFAQVPDNHNPITPAVAVGFDVPIDMVCHAVDEDCTIGFDGDTLLEFDCSTGSCLMTVTDQFIIGDFFEVFDGGESKGLTPDPAPEFTEFSEGTFCFSGGPHVATIQDKTDVAGLPAGFQVVITLQDEDLCPERPVAGELSPINSSALVIAGLTSMTPWMVPAVIGIAGAGIYLVKFRANKE